MHSETTFTRDLIADLILEAATAGGTPHPPTDLRHRLMTRVEGTQMYSLRASELGWTTSEIPGIFVKVLSLDRDRNRATLLVRAKPGAVYPPHRHSGPEDCYVISGTVRVAGQTLHAGDFHHADAHSDHGELRSDTGAEVLLVVAASDYL
jgi:anti-sigma factor ChrR (cupin superfamily)